MAACPYGVRTFNWADPQYSPGITFPTGHQGDHYDPLAGDDTNRLVFTSSRPRGVVEKCSFCVQRIDSGVEPFCIQVCPTGARIFGDLDDDSSKISTVVRNGRATQLLPELGTNPKVYFVPPYVQKQLVPSTSNSPPSELVPSPLIIAQAEDVGGYIPSFSPASGGPIEALPPPPGLVRSQDKEEAP